MKTYSQLHDMLLHTNNILSGSTRERYLDSLANISSLLNKYCETVEYEPKWSMNNDRRQYHIPSNSDWLELTNVNKLPHDILETLVGECDIHKGSTILSVPDSHLPHVYAIRITHPEHDNIDLLFCQDDDPEIENCTWEYFPPKQRLDI